MDALILSCGTGGGHNAAAYAIQEELTRRGDRAVLLNPYTLQSPNLAKTIDRIYITLAQRFPAGFGIVYCLGNLYRRLPFRSPVYFCNRKMAAVLGQYLRENPADVVLVSHLFPAEILTQMKNQGMPVPKSIFIATDYTCIPFTEETDCDAYVIPAQELQDDFLGRGLPAEKLYALGIPVRRDFSHPVSKAEARKALGLEADGRYLLICGGSIGAGKLEKTVDRLYGACGSRAHLIVICGNNEQIYKKLAEKYAGHMTVLESTDRMAEYLRACDLYLSKPGGLSSTEAAAMGVPLIHLPPIPGCETVNARFFQERGMSRIFRLRRSGIRQALSLLDDPAQCEAMRQRQQTVLNKNAAEAICDLAAELVRSNSCRTGRQGSDGL